MVFEHLGKFILKFPTFINNLVSAFQKFGKSSYLSLLFLGAILLMVQGLDQANTLLVDMVEGDKTSLILCFVVISMFAAILSHYPRYIYYAEDINDSRDDHHWYAYKWLGYPIFIFSKINQKDYKQDYKAKYLRQCLGLVIFIIWHYYIYQAFYPKLVFGEIAVALVKSISVILSIIPALILIILLDRFDYYQDKIFDAENVLDEKEAKTQKRKFYTKGVNALLFMIGLVFVMGCIITYSITFSLSGYWLLQIFTFLLAILYILFRAFRVYVIAVHFKLNFISDSIAYLRLYFVFSVLIVFLMVYSNIAVVKGWSLLNAMLILLCYLFLFYYIIACLVKYFFMLQIFKSQEEDLKNQGIADTRYLNNSRVLSKKRERLLPLTKQRKFAVRRRRIASVLILLLVVLCAVSLKTESVIHQLEVYQPDAESSVLYIDEFKDKLRERTDKPLFFVAAHGGGLKANIWTMKVLNEIQEQSEGEFLNQTVSFSGASGGMMGLSLYSVLDGEYTNDFAKISKKIDKVAYENFASKDLAMMFGSDFLRKLYPLSKIGAHRDRSYYSMVTYRNILENDTTRTLDSLSFNAYWKSHIFNNQRGYFPSLIINTAKTNGKRGVFYSVKYPQDSTLFYNSDNLSQLYNGSIAYYEAMSSTNRFPGLSPAAKIKGHGHYIDAGAIDNSGLLSSLDLYNYLEKDSTLNKTPKVFVEIINGRNNYIWHLIQKFKIEKGIADFHIDEIEQDNIVADLKTGLNLDKIPNYLADFLVDRGKSPKITYIPIYLPFQIELKEVEGFLGGKLTDTGQKDVLKAFLDRENAKVKKEINDNESVWKTYEPTLARHLSKSTITYYDRVIQSKLITDQIKEIQALLEE
ncbi:hypothetical protein [Psychroserpens sp. MEBiC05023]